MRSLLPLILVLLGASCPAQSIPEPGDPEVFFHYLYRVHLELQGGLKGQTTTASTAAAFHSPAAALPTLDAAYQNTADALNKIQVETQSYLDARVMLGLLPELPILQKFYSRRTQVIAQARAQLVSRLGTETWSSINHFIDGEYRQHTRRSGISWPNK
jgi:hypothetical protein